MKRLAIALAALALLAVYFHFGGTNQAEPAYLDYYHRAERLYNNENPTAQTDSLAFIFLFKGN